MNHDPKAYLYDIKQACEEIEQFTEGMAFEEYSANSMVKAAVERKFLVIGEAVARLKREHRAIAERVTEHEKIISFRNILVHGYGLVDDAIVWSAVRECMPTLRREIDDILCTQQLNPE
jgi:uncharacterized protein with HEPN domain